MNKRLAAERHGHRSEMLAAWALRLKGYRILASRLKTKLGEIDMVALPLFGPVCFIEVKARGDGNGFRTLIRWLAGHDALFLWQDRKEPLVVVPMHVWLELLSLIGPAMPAPKPEAQA
jgi:hypothetical protein